MEGAKPHAAPLPISGNLDPRSFEKIDLRAHGMLGIKRISFFDNPFTYLDAG